VQIGDLSYAPRDMLSKPRINIALAPTEQPGSGNVQPRRYRQRISAEVFLDSFRAAAEERSKFIEVKEFQGFWSQRNGFSGHEWAFSADTCRYVPADDVTATYRRTGLYRLRKFGPSSMDSPERKKGVPPAPLADND
jgi:hypothetical protein